jgi:predicted AAA+ superfamily ATPase
MNYIKRDLQDVLVSFFSKKVDQIALLSGARQTGKTTIAENIPADEQKVIINLWDEEREIMALRNAATFAEFEILLKTLFNFTPCADQFLIIDEAQASKHISSFLMEMHRKWKGQKILLLGSLLAELYKKGQPMPVGRTVEFVCRPLNFDEFLRFRKKEQFTNLLTDNSHIPDQIHALFMDEYRYYLQIGGLPGIVPLFEDRQNVLLLFESLLSNTYRDADRYIGIDRPGRAAQYGKILETAMKSIAQHLASATQNATILSTDSPAYRTILPLVLDALCNWHICYTIPFKTAQYSSKKGYSSKKYLFDTGVANYLLTHLMPVRFGDGDQVTAMLLENGVLQDIVSRTGSISAIECYHTNNRVSTELDFVVSGKNGLLPFEVKSSSRIKQQTLHQQLDFMERFNVQDGYVVYNGLPKVETYAKKNFHFIPPYMVGTIIRQDDR